MESKHSLSKSFKFAFDGLKEGILKGRNFRIQVGIGIGVAIWAYILKFNRVEWAILILTIAIVIILELLNTAVESLVDLVSPQIKEKARIAKDVAAASVLIGAVISIIIGVLLFAGKLIENKLVIV